MKNITFRDIKRIIIIVIGNYLLALAVGAFILPYDILSGGVAGLAIALKPIIPLDPKVIITYFRKAFCDDDRFIFYLISSFSYLYPYYACCGS
jgi:uncharacterized membrane-anchored protein YitT (DUF2179 family)